MLNRQNPFESESGSGKLTEPANIALIICIVLISAWLIFKMQIVGGLFLMAIPVAAIFLYFLFRYPILGLYSAVAYSFIVLGLGKYITVMPLGTLLDGILLITLLALIFNKFRERVDWSPAMKNITLFSVIWFGYCLFELINPEARSSQAWFSGRGIGVYMLFTVVLTLLLIDDNRKLDTFLYIWAVFSLLATIKGIMQVKFGVDHWEKAWLDAGNAKTHILFGKLRAFSFMSDAGQFGANQGYSGVMALIVSTAQKNKLKKWFFIVVGVLGIYGLVISGTRGALSVPIIGFATFFVLRKNKTIMAAGFVAMVLIVVFFKFTSIGQGNANIRRMRTAFDPNDASLNVRLDNQRRLKNYLASRPFGGGIGHGGVKAQRFLPNAYLSQIATDSGYVLIWVEMGIVGLAMHLFILFYVLGKSCYLILFRIRDPIVKLKFSALASGMAGIIVANYGNAVLTQMPTNILIYVSMAVLLSPEVFDTAAQSLDNETGELPEGARLAVHEKN
jgi:hypothetical protein